MRAFGVEFEMVPNLSRQSLEKALVRAGVTHVKSYSSTTEWALKHDMSVSKARYGDGWELTTPKLTLENYSTVDKVLYEIGRSVVRIRGSQRPVVNTTTGLHVHVDVSDILSNVHAIRHLMLIYLKGEDLLFNLVAPHRRSSRYCRPWRQSADDFWLATEDCSSVKALKLQVNRDFCPESPFNSKYSGLNLSRWDSNHVEFRMHEGTLDRSEVQAWVHLVVTIVSAAVKPYNSALAEKVWTLEHLFEAIGWRSSQVAPVEQDSMEYLSRKMRGH
jgi:hypothetical protein